MLNSNPCDLTVVVNAHAEGMLLRSTLCSVQRAVERARTEGVSVEVLVVLDRPDEATRRCADAFKRAARIIEADYGDPSEARNTGAHSAKGTHVAFVDGDDLVSEHWFWKGLRGWWSASSQLRRSFTWSPYRFVTFVAEWAIASLRRRYSIGAR